MCVSTLWFLPLCLCVHRLVARPCARILQIQAGAPRRVQPNAVLERLYQSNTVHKGCVCSVASVNSAAQCYCSGTHHHRPNDMLSKHLLSFEIPLWFYKQIQYFGVKVPLILYSLESRHETTGGTLQAAGLGGAESTEMVSYSPEPGQTQHTEEVL